MGTHVNTLRWKFDTNDTYLSPPVIDAKGNVFIASRFTLYALNGQTGAVLWTWGDFSNSFYYPYEASPAIVGDAIVFSSLGTDAASLVALSCDSGELRWSTPLDYEGYTSPLVTPNGTVVVRTEAGTTFRIDGYSGALLNSFYGGEASLSTPAASVDGGTLIIADESVNYHDGTLYANDEEGKVLWRYNTASVGSSSPAITADGTVIVGSSEVASVFALKFGALVWQFSTSHSFESSPALSPDGSAVFIACWDSKMYALNMTSGAVLWTFTTGDGPIVNPTTSAVGADGGWGAFMITTTAWVDFLANFPAQ